MKEKDKRIEWINQNNKLKDLFIQHGYKVPVNGVVFCPFHDNTETPSAKLYTDSNTLFCFAETAHYTPYDFLKKILKQSDDTIFENVPSNIVNLVTEVKQMTVPWIEYKYDKFDSEVSVVDYMMNLDQVWRNRDKYKQIKT